MPSEVIFDVEEKEKRVSELERKISRPDFWRDSKKSQKILREKKVAAGIIDLWKRENDYLGETELLFQLAIEGDDHQAMKEVESRANVLQEKIEAMELRRIMSGEDDINNAIVTIHPGAGGVEAQDWAEILFKMYLRFLERRKFKAQILDYQSGDEAGIKNITFIAVGEYAYGYMKAEVGIHRLVRISPFDAGKRRHTSFASVFVYPELDDAISIEIDELDLRIDTYRASGAGGQHVNKTDSAIRITHLPSGIVVQCQNERSQHRNKGIAMKLLKSRLYEQEKREQAEKIDKLHKSKKEIAWGSQIRSYIMHPYQMVKDHRTKVETGNVSDVLDGNLDRFVEALLLNKRN
jgi:peptide chain release factor 2